VKVSFGTSSLLLEIGKLRAILRHFPYSFFVAQRQSWRVIDLMGDVPQNPVLFSELRKRAAHAISQIEEEGRRRRYAEAIKNFEETRRRLEAQIGIAHSPREPSISESQIMLVSPTYAKVDLYPKIAMCNKCETLIDLERLLRITSGHPPSCPVCGGSLIQVNIVFVCPRCSRVVELRPPRSIGEPDRNATFACKECRGPLVLNLVRKNLSESKWACPRCDKNTDVYMKCEQCGEMMKLRQTTQESLYARHVRVLLLEFRLFEEALRD
jgi:tRNA(Ile2) C34 agmatinyltransferase TiaS